MLHNPTGGKGWVADGWDVKKEKNDGKRDGKQAKDAKQTKNAKEGTLGSIVSAAASMNWKYSVRLLRYGNPSSEKPCAFPERCSRIRGLPI